MAGSPMDWEYTGPPRSSLYRSAVIPRTKIRSLNVRPAGVPVAAMARLRSQEQTTWHSERAMPSQSQSPLQSRKRSREESGEEKAVKVEICSTQAPESLPVTRESGWGRRFMSFAGHIVRRLVGIPSNESDSMGMDAESHKRRLLEVEVMPGAWPASPASSAPSLEVTKQSSMTTIVRAVQRALKFKRRNTMSRTAQNSPRSNLLISPRLSNLHAFATECCVGDREMLSTATISNPSTSNQDVSINRIPQTSSRDTYSTRNTSHPATSQKSAIDTTPPRYAPDVVEKTETFSGHSQPRRRLATQGEKKTQPTASSKQPPPPLQPPRRVRNRSLINFNTDEDVNLYKPPSPQNSASAMHSISAALAKAGPTGRIIDHLTLDKPRHRTILSILADTAQASSNQTSVQPTKIAGNTNSQNTTEENVKPIVNHEETISYPSIEKNENHFSATTKGNIASITPLKIVRSNSDSSNDVAARESGAFIDGKNTRGTSAEIRVPVSETIDRDLSLLPDATPEKEERHVHFNEENQFALLKKPVFTQVRYYDPQGKVGMTPSPYHRREFKDMQGKEPASSPAQSEEVTPDRPRNLPDFPLSPATPLFTPRTSRQGDSPAAPDVDGLISGVELFALSREALRRLEAKREAERKAAELAAELERRRIEEEKRRIEERERKEALERRKKLTIITELTPEWEMKLDQALKQSSAANIIAGDLTRKDFGTLLPQTQADGIGWLNDEIVNAYLAKLVEKGLETTNYNKRKAEEIPKYHAFSTHLFSNYTNPKKGYSSVERWPVRAKIGGKRILSTERVFIPINDRSHWTLVAISGTERTIEYYDSMRGNPRKYTGFALDFLKDVLGRDFVATEWKVIDVSSAQQANVLDCGVFVCMNSLALMQRKEPVKAFATGEMPMARRLVAATLMNGGFKGDFDIDLGIA